MRPWTHWLIGCAAALLAQPVWAVHFDVMLDTDPGPVAGARLTIGFYGDAVVGSDLPIDYATGQMIFPGAFEPMANGIYATANPGFQGFAGTLLNREPVHFRGLDTLQFWDPGTEQWGAAPDGVGIRLYGGIPAQVATDWLVFKRNKDIYDFYANGTLFTNAGVTGPVSASIASGASNGSFHAHLNWFLDGNNAPAGAYLMELQLTSPVTVGGVPKYLDSAPFYVLLRHGISDSQYLSAFTARIHPVPEPQTAVLVAAGLLALASWARRGRRIRTRP